MSLPYEDPALPSNPNPYFTDNSFARGDQQRANNGFIWGNLEDLDARVTVLEGADSDLQEQIDEINDTITGRLGVKRRQCIFGGAVDSDGRGNFLSASGLNITLLATSTPVRLAFAAGFDADGAIDYVEEITTDATNAWTAPSGNTVSSMTRSSQTVTATTSAVHNMAVGDVAFYTSTVQFAYIGERVTATVPTTTTLTWTLPGTVTDGTPVTNPVMRKIIWLYVDRNPSTGALTYGYTTKGFVWGTKEPTGVTSGYHWFDLINKVMKSYNGSTWDTVQRVFVGEAYIDSASAVVVQAYDLHGGYKGGIYNSSVTNADDTTSFAYGIEGGVVPSVNTSQKYKRISTRPLREGQRLVIELATGDYSPNTVSYSTAYTLQAPTADGIDFSDTGVRHQANANGCVADIGFLGAGIKGQTWANLAIAGFRWRTRIIPVEV